MTTSKVAATTARASVVQLGERDTWQIMPTPVGDMLLAGDDEALHRVLLPGTFQAEGLPAESRGRAASTREAASQIRAYFGRDLKEFDLPLDPKGSDFQRSVWFALADIPYGATESYGSLAARIGKPSACRAVGATNGRNPLPLVLPCHRVIGSNGSLTGYGGGLDLKLRLLEHEGWERPVKTT